MEITCILVDDERPLRESLARLITEYCPGLTIVGKAADTEQAGRLLAENQVDVIFCDIRMPQENGIDFLSRIDAGRYHVVFVTAYNEYALEAIKARAFDYLLKPVDPQELKTTAQALQISIAQKRESETLRNRYSDSLKQLLREVVSQPAVSEKVAIHHTSGIVFLELGDILYLEGDGCYTIVHRQNGQKVMATRTLSDFEEQLSTQKFFRIHKSFVVNLQHVTEYLRADGFFLLLKNGEQLPIGRRRVQAVLDRMAS